MKITKYRTVAIIHPFLSLECEVKDGDKTYYANISVNNKGEKEEFAYDRMWAYKKPMDEIGYDKDGNEIDYDEDYEASCIELKEEIFRQMYEFWNQNPVFKNDTEWKEWK